MLFKQHLSPFEGWFDKMNKKNTPFRGCLQFSAALNIRQRSLVESISITESKEGLTFEIVCEQSALAEKCKLKSRRNS